MKTLLCKIFLSAVPLATLALSGCHCCQVSERYGDVIDAIADRQCAMDRFYRPGLDLTRICEDCKDAERACRPPAIYPNVPISSSTDGPGVEPGFDANLPPLPDSAPAPSPVPAAEPFEPPAAGELLPVPVVPGPLTRNATPAQVSPTEVNVRTFASVGQVSRKAQPASQPARHTPKAIAPQQIQLTNAQQPAAGIQPAVKQVVTRASATVDTPVHPPAPVPPSTKAAPVARPAAVSAPTGILPSQDFYLKYVR